MSRRARARARHGRPDRRGAARADGTARHVKRKAALVVQVREADALRFLREQRPGAGLRRGETPVLRADRLVDDQGAGAEQGFLSRREVLRAAVDEVVDSNETHARVRTFECGRF